MSALHATTVFNIEATVNNWFRTKAATISLPSVMSFSYDIITLWPETPLVPPCIALAHAGIGRTHAFVGQVAGSGEIGLDAANLVDISCWASKKTASGVANPNWTSQLRLLRGVVEEIFASPVSFIVKDYRASLTSPSDTTYRIHTRALQGGNIVQDPNPAIIHVSYSLRYEWVQRTNITA